ncbi:MAG: hypothetical protein FJY07_12105, partial [Bacteroidetes bacterium]|nr:hypothetical protein [Bacteroidota bacterium]
MAKIILRLLFWCVIIHLFAGIMASCGDNQNQGSTLLEKIESVIEREPPDEYEPVTAMILLPGNPAPGERFRILATGGRKIRKAKIIVKSQSGELESVSYKTGNELPCWRIEYFDELKAGVYEAVLILDNKATDTLQFEIAPRKEVSVKNIVWKAVRGWNSGMETLYSAWVNALFQGNDEQASWSALHEVTQNKENNFLYNYLTLDEDNPAGKTRVIMEPDCADNPFYLRAYFSWKLGLPFGYHVCDRGYLGRNPQTGQWITN